MVDPVENLLVLLGIAVIGLVVWAALAPFETLGWWAGWFGEPLGEPQETDPPTRPDVRPDVALFGIYLSGISRASDETLSRREQRFLALLREAMPRAEIIDDIFPYSVNNLPLTGQRFFAAIWRWALRRKLSPNRLERLAGYLINIRNIWQIAISVDRRYGPIYNQAVAQVMYRALLSRGFDPQNPVPVVLIGYSGAAQIAVGAAAYLKPLVESSLVIVSLGGIFGSDPGLLAMDRMVHLYGTRDRLHWLGWLLFPGRWPFLWYSAWNKALRAGKIAFLCLGPMAHAGPGGYLAYHRTLPDGTPFVVKTVQTIADLFPEARSPSPKPGAGGPTPATRSSVVQSG